MDETKQNEIEYDEGDIKEETDAPVKKEKKESKSEKPESKSDAKANAKVAELEKELEKAKQALSDSEDKYLRMMAEYDNFRKRSAKEKEGVWADAYGDCISNLLPVLDNLERAAVFDQLDAVKKGLEMTVKAFSEALNKMGVEEVETNHFDPNLHNAVMHVEDETLGESQIVEVFQKGYRKGDKIIRYAMVKVAN